MCNCASSTMVQWCDCGDDGDDEVGEMMISVCVVCGLRL